MYSSRLRTSDAIGFISEMYARLEQRDPCRRNAFVHATNAPNRYRSENFVVQTRKNNKININDSRRETRDYRIVQLLFCDAPKDTFEWREVRLSFARTLIRQQTIENYKKKKKTKWKLIACRKSVNYLMTENRVQFHYFQKSNWKIKLQTTRNWEKKTCKKVKFVEKNWKTKATKCFNEIVCAKSR